jgi:hypothetical protein
MNYIHFCFTNVRNGYYMSSNLYAKFCVVFAMKNETVEKKATENTAKNKMKSDIAALQKAYEIRLIGFLKKMNAVSPDNFVEFERNNPLLAGKKIIAFLSSE